MAEEVAAGGALAAALGTDEFRRGMELAGIAGQVQVVAELLGGVGQPTLAAFLGRTSHQLRALSVDALQRATEDVIVAHGAEHVAGELAALGLSEVGAGPRRIRDLRGLGRRQRRDGRGSRAISRGRSRGARRRDGHGWSGRRPLATEGAADALGLSRSASGTAAPSEPTPA